MNSSEVEPIGGFLGLEASPGAEPLPDDAILLNSGRACFDYFLDLRRPAHVWLPGYLCDVLLKPLDDRSIPYDFYPVDQRLEGRPTGGLNSNELVLAIDYFGIKSAFVAGLAQEFGSALVVDASQAFYSRPPTGSAWFCSPRKFFGLPDGGMLRMPADWPRARPDVVDDSSDRLRHLFLRLESGPEAAYDAYRANEDVVADLPAAGMSELTRTMLTLADRNRAREIRTQNFREYHESLGATNTLPIDLAGVDGPYAYPYLHPNAPALRSEMLRQRIFVPTLWPNSTSDGRIDSELSQLILPLPLDQRVSSPQIRRVLEVIDAGS
jgi:hypothetical protein